MAKSAALKATEVGTNVRYTEDADTLTITIDKNHVGQPSKSGKTIIVASTQGNKPMGGLIVGINAYRWAAKKQRTK